jgi:hypothetical protein
MNMETENSATENTEFTEFTEKTKGCTYAL